MSRQIQIRRGSAPEHNNFVGAIGEITMDTDNKTLRVHDGETVGGIALAKQSEIPDLTNADYVIEWQAPSAENNYTWYRKYKSGWIEQGGTSTVPNIVFPIPFSNENYCIHSLSKMINESVGNISICYNMKTNSKITIQIRWNGDPQDSAECMWYACGY